MQIQEFRNASRQDSQALNGISVIVVVFNEAIELKHTVSSIYESTSDFELLIVDDGSTDQGPDQINPTSFRLISHAVRTGVGTARDDAAVLASGNALAFVDGHQRLTDGCLNQCSDVALQRRSIVTPDICGFDDTGELMHGASFHLAPRRPPFGAHWRMLKPREAITRISSLKAPAYVIPADIYHNVRWSRLLRGWGGSEACVSLKAFFTDTPILHLCGPIAYHKFKKKFHYEVTWDEVWRNHALISRICFSEATWRDYWLPEVFQDQLNEETRREMDSDAVIAEHLEFQQLKVRPDHEFWTRLAFQKVPAAVQK